MHSLTWAMGHGGVPATEASRRSGLQTELSILTRPGTQNSVIPLIHGDLVTCPTPSFDGFRGLLDPLSFCVSTFVSTHFPTQNS